MIIIAEYPHPLSRGGFYAFCDILNQANITMVSLSRKKGTILEAVNNRRRRICRAIINNPKQNPATIRIDNRTELAQSAAQDVSTVKRWNHNFKKYFIDHIKTPKKPLPEKAIKQRLLINCLRVTKLSMVLDAETRDPPQLPIYQGIPVSPGLGNERARQ